MGCHICKSIKRPVRFKTNRIEICQWCVSFLTDNPIDPKILYEVIEDKIESHVEKQLECQAISRYEAEENAKNAINYPKGLNRLFTSIFTPSRMRVANGKLNKYTSHIYEESRRSAESAKKAQTEKLYSQVFDERNGPQKLSYVNTYTGSVGYSDLISPLKVKYFNALKYGLIAGSDKLSRPSDEEWEVIRKRVMAEDRYKCKICGVFDAEKHVHHIIPISKYGTNSLSNLVTLCYKCHDKQHPDFKISKRT